LPNRSEQRERPRERRQRAGLGDGGAQGGVGDGEDLGEVPRVLLLLGVGRRAAAVKAKIYRLFGREKSVHSILGGGKRESTPPSAPLVR
jgi:hypothetical protein